MRVGHGMHFGGKVRTSYRVGDGHISNDVETSGTTRKNKMRSMMGWECGHECLLYTFAAFLFASEDGFFIHQCKHKKPIAASNNTPADLADRRNPFFHRSELGTQCLDFSIQTLQLGTEVFTIFHVNRARR